MGNQITKQKPGDGKCAACVAAMATGTTPDAFEEFIRAHFPERSPNERGYSDLHVYSYLLSHGYLCGLGFIAPKIEEGKVHVELTVQDFPAYVVVRSSVSGRGHALYWDGQQLHDPDPQTPSGRSPSHYKIELWVPIYQVAA